MLDVRTNERREFQRLSLDPAIDGTFAGTPVVLNEIGILGARIRHREALPARGELRFEFGGAPVALRGEIVRTISDDPTAAAAEWESGMRFVAALEDSGDRLRDMLVKLVTVALEKRYEDSGATRLRIREIDGDNTVRGVDAQFVSYRLENNGWRKRHVFLPEQPSLGFTVARGENSDELQRLCAVYEASDEEGRRLIRLFAELSVSGLLRIPPAS